MINYYNELLWQLGLSKEERNPCPGKVNVINISSRRKVMSNLDNAREATDILFQKVAKAFSAKNSGFTRIISLPRRVGDNAQMVRMEWTEKVEFEGKKKPEVKEKGKKVEEKPKKAAKKEVKPKK